MSLYFALYTVENNKNKKSVKFQGDMLNFCDFIQVYVFTTNHHLNGIECQEESICFNSFVVFFILKRLQAVTPCSFR